MPPEECEYLGQFLDPKTVQRIAHGELDPREYEMQLQEEEDRKVREQEERLRVKEARKREESEKVRRADDAKRKRAKNTSSFLEDLMEYQTGFAKKDPAERASQSLQSSPAGNRRASFDSQQPAAAGVRRSPRQQQQQAAAAAAGVRDDDDEYAFDSGNCDAEPSGGHGPFHHLPTDDPQASDAVDLSDMESGHVAGAVDLTAFDEEVSLQSAGAGASASYSGSAASESAAAAAAVDNRPPPRRRSLDTFSPVFSPDSSQQQKQRQQASAAARGSAGEAGFGSDDGQSEPLNPFAASTDGACHAAEVEGVEPDDASERLQQQWQEDEEQEEELTPVEQPSPTPSHVNPFGGNLPTTPGFSLENARNMWNLPLISLIPY